MILRQNLSPAIVGCFCVLSFLTVLVMAAPWLSPSDLSEVNLLDRFRPPVFMGGTWQYPLGTDALGRDMLSLILRAIQVSLTIAVIGTIGGAIVGTTLGLVAAWIGGILDAIVGTLVDFQATIPTLILILALITVLPSADFTVFVAIMIFHGWDRYARLARAIALSAKSQPYVQAQQIMGASTFRIITRSVLPNAMAVLLVNMSINFPQTILAETTLSFLGVGIQPPDVSLGLLIGIGRDQLFNAPWVALMPGFLILITTISISVLGDWARDLVEAD
ncbi:ABC transporter permease [Mesorhizobium escarrei]|uniref:Peptide ABC transporter permease n=1 Tax=Mesorhizobium escarrei TaxID=666018 RepID=A0ABM9DZX3_9HYPH|nr:ABC transporter permease [Mesorhizobium escarrei]CAH2402353.1 Peptide ABC transporter permease [Mesorhizobium escarrei]